MTPIRRGALALAWVCLLLTPGQAQSPEPPVFRVAADTVAVDVYVGRGGRPVRGLRAEDFEVRDNGHPQAVELVTSEASGLHVVLLLDRSQSMNGQRLAEVKSAAHLFLSGLGDKDRVTLLAFDYQVSLLASAAPPAAAAVRLDALEARGPTALRDALYAGMKAASAKAAGRSCSCSPTAAMP